MEQKSTFWKSAMIYGLYIGIAVTLYSVILYVAGQSTNKSLGYASILIYVVCIVMAQIHYRDHELKGTITYGQAVGFAVSAMLFSGIITALYTLIIFKIDPGLIDQIKGVQEEAMSKQGLNDDQIEQAMSIASKMMTPGWLSIMGILNAVIYGTIISLVSSIFIKKLPKEDAFEEAMEEVKTED
jgi:high-affinity nickel permease